MYKTEIQYNSSDKRFFFVISDEKGVLLFQSGEWNTEKECRDGFTGFKELLEKGSFDKNTLPTEQEDHFQNRYVSDKNEIWGHGAAKKSMKECKIQYEALKNLLKNSNSEETLEQIPLDPRSLSFLYSLDGAGTDPKENPTNEKQWELKWSVSLSVPDDKDTFEERQFELWKNETIRDQFTKKYFINLPKSSEEEDTVKEDA
ncbi:MAG: hypothetical protein K6F51_03580 [Acetatifactor sp.]|nr:hypothetical protein [Acetatifactor sp.]